MPLSRSSTRMGARAGSAISATSRWKVCSSANSPPSAACSTWSVKTSQQLWAGKSTAVAGAGLLKIVVQLGGIMQRQHQLVIGAAAAAGDAQLFIEPGLAGQMRADTRQKAAGERLERFAHQPVPRRGRRDIGEEAQDAPPRPHRARGKGIDVQQTVVGDFGIAAALHFHRTIAGAGAFDLGDRAEDRAPAKKPDRQNAPSWRRAGGPHRLAKMWPGFFRYPDRARCSWPCRPKRVRPGTAFRCPRAGRTGRERTAPRRLPGRDRARLHRGLVGAVPVGQRQGLKHGFPSWRRRSGCASPGAAAPAAPYRRSPGS